MPTSVSCMSYDTVHLLLAIVKAESTIKQMRVQPGLMHTLRSNCRQLLPVHALRC